MQGFLYVASGPLVRSSFKANELLKSAAGKRLLQKVQSQSAAGLAPTDLLASQSVQSGNITVGARV